MFTHDELWKWLNNPFHLNNSQRDSIISWMTPSISLILKSCINDNERNEITVSELLIQYGFLSSKREIRDLIKANSLAIGNKKVTNESQLLNEFPFFNLGDIENKDENDIRFVTVIKLSKKNFEIIFD